MDRQGVVGDPLATPETAELLRLSGNDDGNLRLALGNTTDRRLQ